MGQVLGGKENGRSSLQGDDCKFADATVYSYSKATTASELPCVLCHVPTRTMQIMILPAMNTCPAGWTKEYHGYLVSSNVRNSAKLHAFIRMKLQRPWQDRLEVKKIENFTRFRQFVTILLLSSKYIDGYE